MVCENCGRNNANIKYTQIINGEKKQMYLCEQCGEKLGIVNDHFNMPIDFSSFLEDFFNEVPEADFLPTIKSRNQLKCSKCGLLFEDFLHTGKFGCSNCYSDFEEMIDPILKNIQGANKHRGRIGNVSTEEIKLDNTKSKKDKEPNSDQKSELETLKEDLRLAIKEERYEDAATLRDKIKKLEG